MNDSVTFIPVFTGTSEWRNVTKGRKELFNSCVLPIDRAIFRDNYKTLALSFGSCAVTRFIVEDMQLKWESGSYIGGTDKFSFQLTPQYPNLKTLQGFCVVSWFKKSDKPISSPEDIKIYPAREDFISHDEKVTTKKEEEFEVTIHLREFTFETESQSLPLPSPFSSISL